MTVVELARLTNSAHLLPTALLVCTTLETELFTSNILAPGNLVRVMQGKAALANAGSSLFFASLRFILQLEDECAKENNSLLQSLMRDLADGFAELLKGLDPFGSDPCLLIENSEDDELFPVLCPECQQSFRKETERLVRVLWSDLPGMFGLVVEGWPGA